jgi:hypothetical protein
MQQILLPKGETQKVMAMKKYLSILLVLVVFLFMTTPAYAHSGRLDKKGGHNCSAKSKKKGLCTGCHYHKKK